MIELIREFERNGCAVLPSVASDADVASATAYCNSSQLSRVGTRDLLQLAWCSAMARSIRSVPGVQALLGESKTAVQCTLFVKDERRNWLVPLHRDYSIPVRTRIASTAWSAWSMKQSTTFARPPESLLEALVAVRVHLEDTDMSNGALEVVEGSHRSKVAKGLRKSHFVPRGGALVMRPLLLHASSKLASGRRRVLHFVYGPAGLPDGAEWANAV